ncbi:MAG TPA: hypothetical protein VGT81_06190, partial [Casimicrobiaceae bacterium]|nr:hypothetical protein [Casimicrobiaceae bacterium]
IRVRVQARLARESRPKSPKKQLDNASAATLLMLASELGESPLAQALRRLASKRSRTDSVGNSVDNRRHGDEPLEGVEDENPEQ